MPSSQVAVGLSNSAMVLSDEAADAQLTGGLAAKAGEGYAAAAAGFWGYS